MAVSVIEVKGKGALLLDSHPAGCARSVELAEQELTGGPATATGRPPTVLVIGSSAGYGQAITVAGLVGQRMSGIGLCLERPAGPRRSASAGWYRIGAMADLARRHGADFEFHNADCYAEATKAMVLDRLAGRPLDYLIYSVASPRRTDPTGTTYQSVIKPIGAGHSTYSLDLDEGGRRVRTVAVDAGTQDEVDATVKVMGGEDWADWVRALAGRDLVAPGFTTVALSYIGSSLTAPIYRHGTIGQAKNHLEATADELTDLLRSTGGRALTSVNGAAVTQASSAIPGISLYLSQLHAVLGPDLQSPATQAGRLWRHLTGAGLSQVDDQGRIRLDDWEFADGVQPAVESAWKAAVAAGEISAEDARWFVDEVHRLYGFAVPGVDYTQPVETDLPWPTAGA